eukprot:Sdes_comp10556_c0_seq1m2249
MFSLVSTSRFALRTGASRILNTERLALSKFHTFSAFLGELDEKAIAYREARFLGKEKKLNSQRAIDLIAQVPPQEVEESIVSCDGGGGALGHPKVYINLDQPGAHDCGYCGLRFVKKTHH